MQWKHRFERRTSDVSMVTISLDHLLKRRVLARRGALGWRHGHFRCKTRIASSTSPRAQRWMVTLGIVSTRCSAMKYATQRVDTSTLLTRTPSPLILRCKQLRHMHASKGTSSQEVQSGDVQHCSTIQFNQLQRGRDASRRALLLIVQSSLSQMGSCNTQRR